MTRYRYKKGADAERELAKLLNAEKFAVVRAAGSGGTVSVPDVIGIKKDIVLAFECKTWQKKPRLTAEEVKELRNWCTKAGARGFLAWRKRGKWLFLNIDRAKEDIEEGGLDFKQLLKAVRSK